jgi:hypothetical protein
MVRANGGALDLVRPAGRRIEVTVSAPRYDTTVWRVAAAHVTKLCVPLGDTRPRRTC